MVSNSQFQHSNGLPYMNLRNPPGSSSVSCPSRPHPHPPDTGLGNLRFGAQNRGFKEQMRGFTFYIWGTFWGWKTLFSCHVSSKINPWTDPESLFKVWWSQMARGETLFGIFLFSAPGSSVASSHISIWGWVKTYSITMFWGNKHQ